MAREVARRDVRVELDRDPRILLAQPGQRRRDERARQTGRGRDPHDALGEVLDVARIAGEPRVRRFHRLGGGEHALRRARRLQALARALEQALAEVLLERGEPAAHRRGVEPEPARRGGERVAAMNREEDPDVIPADVLQICHGRLQYCALRCIRARRRLRA